MSPAYPDTSPTVDIEAERGLLGSILTDPTVWDEVAERLRPQDFAYPQHAAVWAAMVSCDVSGRPLDAVNIAAALERTGRWGREDGIPLLRELAASGSLNHLSYAEIVIDRSKKRHVAEAGRTMLSAANDPQVDGDATLALAEKSVLTIGAPDEGRGVISLRESLDILMEGMGKGGTTAGRQIPTGFTALDELTRGMFGSQLILVAGRPGAGKTAFGMQLLYKAALETGRKCVIVSYEMTHLELTERLTAAVLGVRLKDIQNGRIGSDVDERAVLAGIEQMKEVDLEIIDQPPKTWPEVLGMLRRINRKTPLGAFGIDYIQMMQGDNRRNSSRADDLGEIAYGCKYYAKELDVPAIVMSQLNRKGEERVDPRPRSSDLRDSGALEQAADVIMFLYRPSRNDSTIAAEEAELIVDKQRSGEAPRMVPLHWDGPRVRYRNHPTKTSHVPVPAGNGGGRGHPAPPF